MSDTIKNGKKAIDGFTFFLKFAGYSELSRVELLTLMAFIQYIDAHELIFIGALEEDSKEND